jgi:hypothetical protein
MITFIDLYNKITGQAWSMFDGDIDSSDEFETSVTTAIQKALSDLWCSYKFPFRYETQIIKTRVNKSDYPMPIGNIIQKTIRNKKVYGVKLDKTFLSYDSDYEIFDDEFGKPEKFYTKNDTIYFYPIPDDYYKIELEYLTISPAKDENGASIPTLTEETDYIDIPEKYEILFLNALMSLSMIYLIASESDENYSSYKKQYEKAYKILIDFTKDVQTDKCIGWR